MLDSKCCTLEWRIISLWGTVVCLLLGVATAYRPLKEKEYFPELSGGRFLNISGAYKGTWSLGSHGNFSNRFPVFQKTSGNILFELTSTATSDIQGVHYVQGVVVLRDGIYIGDDDLQMRMEGVYVWPFCQLRMVLSSALDSELNRGEHFLRSNPYHLLSMFSDTPRTFDRRRRTHGKVCRIQLVTKISTRVPDFKHGGHELRRVHEMQGLVEAPSYDDDDDQGDCFSPMSVNATTMNVELYYNKAVNYTLMVTFISFLQVLFLIRQMEHSNTQSGAAKVSLMMIGQQAIMDAYLCLLHLTAGVLVGRGSYTTTAWKHREEINQEESLFNAFATAAFFKFVIFSIFEMRYLLAVWKSQRPISSGEGWETMRRELAVLYSRFYGLLLGGILLMYELHTTTMLLLRYMVLLLYSFWIPQIVANAARDARKPLHPHYVVGITVTRLAIPLYALGCPSNITHIHTSLAWCTGLSAFLGSQAAVLLLQHYRGARCFIPRQVTPCDHFFHTRCLQRWMDIEMECPTCRRALPPM